MSPEQKQALARLDPLNSLLSAGWRRTVATAIPIRRLLIGMLFLGSAASVLAQNARWYEFQGRCFGYFQQTARTVDLYNLYWNCPAVRIKGQRAVPVQALGFTRTKQVLEIDNRGHRDSCPFTIVTVTPLGDDAQLPSAPDVLEVAAYASAAAFEKAGKDSAEVAPFRCGAYLVDADKRPQIVRPQGPHGRSVRDQRRAKGQTPARTSSGASDAAGAAPPQSSDNRTPQEPFR